MRKLVFLAVWSLLLPLTVVSLAGAYTYNFSISAAEIIADIHASGDYLYGNYGGGNGPNGESRWGILGLRILPVNLGAYSLSSSATSVTTWQAGLPASDFVGSGFYPGGSFAYFKINDFIWPTADVIADRPITDFPYQYASYPASPLVRIADDATFSFTLTASSPWSGDYRFLVDGVKYLYSEQGSLSPDARMFTAGLLDSLGLQHDNGLGYPSSANVPLPGSVILLGSALFALAAFRNRKSS